MRKSCFWFTALFISFSCTALAGAETSVVAIVGAEQQTTSGTFDKGLLSLTVHGVTETVAYGQFSTNASIASAIAAKFSQDCSSVLVARASGATVTFETRDPAITIGGSSSAVTYDDQDFSSASFGINSPLNPPPAFNATISCSPSMIISGENLTCAVTLLSGATSPVTFAVGNAAWTSAIPDQAGTAVATAPLTEGTAGSYTISFLYPGDGNIPAASGSTAVTVYSSGQPSNGTPLYSFSITDQNGNSGYAPNGNIVAYIDQVNGTWTLGYDTLNRLTSSSDSASVSGCWGYDAFGNMQTEGISSKSFANAAGCVPQTGATTLQNTMSYTAANRLTSPTTWLDSSKNTHSGTPLYDGDGRIIDDLLNKYLYNPQGQVCAVQANGSYIGYLYDAEGHRVAKGTLPSLTCDPTNLQITNTYFIGPDGETMTETSTTGWVRTEVSAGGQYIATYKSDGIHYAITDWLGSKRMTVNPALSSGNGIEEQCSSFPFGDQQVCNTPFDASPRHFTGKERDVETGLDYFGARYYESGMGPLADARLERAGGPNSLCKIRRSPGIEPIRLRWEQPFEVERSRRPRLF